MSLDGAIGQALLAARPRVLAALLRYFRDLDTAEEAFQQASVRALERWADRGVPADTVAWLSVVGRNATLDSKRRSHKETDLDAVESHPQSSEDDIEAGLASALDDAHYADDVLRLLFVCCHPELSPAQQIPLALRVIGGLSVKEIARAFLSSESAIEQRITRAKNQISEAQIPFEAPSQAERSQRRAAVAAVVYLIFNEGYSATGGDAHLRASLCDEAIRLARLLLALSPDEPSMMGLCALLLLQHARASARLDDRGEIVLLEAQDRSRWDRALIREGLSLLDAGIARAKPDAYLVQAAIAALHARAERAEETDWVEIELLYRALEDLRPSPVVTLNRAVAVQKTRGSAAALELIAPLEARLADYFHFHGVRGALLRELGRLNEARIALQRALELAKTPAEARHIRNRLTEIAASLTGQPT